MRPTKGLTEPNLVHSDQVSPVERLAHTRRLQRGGGAIEHSNDRAIPVILVCMLKSARAYRQIFCRESRHVATMLDAVAWNTLRIRRCTLKRNECL